MTKSRKKKDKFDSDFARANRKILFTHALSNVRRLLAEGNLLFEKGFFSRACHLFLSGLEEWVKALVLRDAKDETIDVRLLKRLVAHEEKAGIVFDIFNISSKGKTAPEIALEMLRKESKRAEYSQRFSQVLQDTMYTRLKETKNDKFSPDDGYWEKRARSYGAVLKLLFL